MTEFICLTCHHVILAGNLNDCSSCGSKKLEPFDPCKHGKLLVSHSNTWLIVRDKWSEHPFFERVSDELRESGCVGAASIFNEAVTRLLNLTLPNSNE